MKNLIQKDKLLHLIAGIYIYLLCRIFLPQTISLGIVVIIGVLKELIWDQALKKGTPELLDSWFTIIGGLSVRLFEIFEVQEL